MNGVTVLLPSSSWCELKHNWIQPCRRVHCKRDQNKTRNWVLLSQGSHETLKWG